MLFFWNAILSLGLQSTFHQFPLSGNWGKWADKHEGKHARARVDKHEASSWRHNWAKFVGCRFTQSREFKCYWTRLKIFFTSRLTELKVNKTKHSSMPRHTAQKNRVKSFISFAYIAQLLIIYQTRGWKCEWSSNAVNGTRHRWKQTNNQKQ